MVDLKGKARAVKSHPDFKDPKYKVGRGNLKPQNEMKTDFKQKRITLARQSGISENISDPLLELFARCRHYAGKRRAEAFRELQTRRSEIPAGMHANFVSTVCQGLMDDEKDVRKLACTFFNEISDSASEALGLSLRAALCHVNVEIRTDALKLATSMNLNFLSDTSGMEIAKTLTERRITNEVAAVVLKLINEVFLVRDFSAQQWRIAALKDIDHRENVKTPFLNALVRKISGYISDDLKAKLVAAEVTFPEVMDAAKKRKIVAEPDRLLGRTFAVGGRAFAALMEDE